MLTRCSKKAAGAAEQPCEYSPKPTTMLRQAHPEPEPEQFPDRDYLLRNLRQRACLDILRDTKPEHRAEAMRVFRKADGMLAEPEPVKLGISREPETGDQR